LTNSPLSSAPKSPLTTPPTAAPPPIDDARPNETTWTVFKKRIDAERAKAGPAPERK
jgi:hypothetical protein